MAPLPHCPTPNNRYWLKHTFLIRITLIRIEFFIHLTPQIIPKSVLAKENFPSNRMISWQFDAGILIS